MANTDYKEFKYQTKLDYDKKIKINGESLSVYSKSKMQELYPDNNFNVVGETFESKKRDKEKDIGRIELNEKRLNVSSKGTHNKIFRKDDAYVSVQGGGFISILELRLLAFIIIGVVAVCMITGIILGIALSGKDPVDPYKPDPHIDPIDSDVLTISGTVVEDTTLVNGATLVLKSGNTEYGTTSTGSDGKYLFAEVKNGVYNVVCTYNDSVLTKVAIVSNESVVVDFAFIYNAGVKAVVEIADDKTPPVTVDGLSEEAKIYAEAGKSIDVTLFAAKKEDSDVLETEKNAIQEISGELDLDYYDFSLLKEVYKDSVLESSEYLKTSNNVMEISFPYDSSRAVGTYVFRYFNDEAVRLEELDNKPTSDYTDGTYYVTADYIYIYTNCFCTYSVGSAFTENVVKGSDTITYSSKAVINLTKQTISMLYEHDNSSTNDVRIELYLIASPDNLLISTSGIVPVGYKLETMELNSNVESVPSVGTYEGIMRIIYLDSNAQASTNVEIPLTIVITR